ncbi:MAG: adenine phosphoribosyltransferase [Nitriliruptoraceae bacterium]
MKIEFDTERLASYIRDIPDFPKPGVNFKDMTPLLIDHVAFSTAIDALVMHFGRGTVDKVVGIEARGFILGAPVAYHFGAGFIPARKAGKLPSATRSVAYELEYGDETLEIHEDAIRPGDRVLIVDDVLATGGTASAAASLVESLGGRVVGLGFLLELSFLGGAARLEGRDHVSLIRY